jgi:hypothetical protein
MPGFAIRRRIPTRSSSLVEPFDPASKRRPLRQVSLVRYVCSQRVEQGACRTLAEEALTMTTAKGPASCLLVDGTQPAASA